ncbi:MAG: hypothetical protein K8S97_08655, partial [Anaerolineae bacterium]|nr:hypothetical protein [Anaerolineae bacterium]
KDDIYWTEKDDWPVDDEGEVDTEAVYYSPVFMAAVGAIGSQLNDLMLLLVFFVTMLALYLAGTWLWQGELHAIVGISFTGLLPVVVFMTHESFWANATLANVALGLYAAYAVTVWSARKQRVVVAALMLFAVGAMKPNFLFGPFAAVVLVWNDDRKFVRNVVIGTVGLYVAGFVLAALWKGPQYVFELHIEWVQMILNVSSNYPFVDSGDFWTSNSSLLALLHRFGVSDLEPVVLLLQLAALVAFATGLYRAIQGGLSWTSNPVKALGWTLLGYLLAGWFSAVFMDFILLPVLFYYVIGTGQLASRRWQIAVFVFFWPVVLIGAFMGYGLHFYLIATIVFGVLIARTVLAPHAAATA